ncbi:hypothetical protein PPYR_10512 [Photinus pyralis]|uniref:Uncharacterized protein n=1 Tax=Photinus pyralis TaxID=7054 RepID=A0A5N4AGK3_PHOPY|nr:hypothetical protein PPYR_10512 [Photinus pyralis]
MPRGSIDEEDIDNGCFTQGSWRNDSTNIPRSTSGGTSNHSSRYARQIRDMLCDYFVGEGAVPWQERMIY